MELRVDGLAFSIMFTPPDSDGWTWCNAIVNAPGFLADLDLQMLRSDLESFRSQLAASVMSENWPCDLQLVSTDPGIRLSFRVKHTGKITGTYQFGGLGANHAMLSGNFEMDQTYLPPLLAQVELVLAQLD